MRCLFHGLCLSFGKLPIFWRRCRALDQKLREHDLHSFVAEETAEKVALVLRLEGVHVDGAGLTRRALSRLTLAYLEFLSVDELEEYLQQWLDGVTLRTAQQYYIVFLLFAAALSVAGSSSPDHPRAGLLLTDKLPLQVLLDKNLISHGVQEIVLALDVVGEVVLHLVGVLFGSLPPLQCLQILADLDIVILFETVSCEVDQPPRGGCLRGLARLRLLSRPYFSQFGPLIHVFNQIEQLSDFRLVLARPYEVECPFMQLIVHSLLGIQFLLLLLTDQFFLDKSLLVEKNVSVEFKYDLMPALLLLCMLLSYVVKPESGLSNRSQALLEKFDLPLLLYFLSLVFRLGFQVGDVPFDVLGVLLITVNGDARVSYRSQMGFELLTL